MMLFGWTASAQQMPCPFEYPDTPLNLAWSDADKEQGTR
jgi:hypothetical protein